MSNVPPPLTGWAAKVVALIDWCRRNPVIPLDLVKALLAVGAVLGWWVAPAEPITDLTTAAAAVAFAALSWATHRTTSARFDAIAALVHELSGPGRHAAP